MSDYKIKSYNRDENKELSKNWRIVKMKCVISEITSIGLFHHGVHFVHIYYE